CVHKRGFPVHRRQNSQPIDILHRIGRSVCVRRMDAAFFAECSGRYYLYRMRRNFFRPVWVILALLLLLEAWLWDHLEPIVARIVNVIPWGRVKTILGGLIEKLPPYASLVVFIVPVIVLLPLKFLEVYFIATANWFAAIVALVFAKLVGLGVTAFVFDVTRGKLLQIAWFRRMYDWFIWARDWARTQTEPIRARIRKIFWLFMPERAGRTFRRLIRLRRSYNRPA
ncbi:MAG: hypothetical protein WAR02_10770, partial [Pseudolabrys sp.]